MGVAFLLYEKEPKMKWQKTKAVAGGKGYCDRQLGRRNSKDHIGGQFRDWTGKSGEKSAFGGC